MIKDALLALFDRLTSPVLKPEPVVLTDCPNAHVVAVRNDYKLSTLPAGRHKRPSRGHVFADVDSFAAFVQKHYPDGGAVEILADTERITAINAQAWDRDEVSCVLTKHPDLIGWERLFGGTMKQTALVRELIARSHTLPPAEVLISTLQRLDLSNVTEASYHMNDNGNFDVKGQRQTTSMSAKLPGSFTVNVPIYLDGPVVALTVGLVIEGVTGEPTFSLRPKNLDMAKLEAYRGEVGNLRDLLGEGYLVGAGKLALEA